MKNLNLYALANELNLGDPRSGTIRIPFGRWDFGEKQLGDGRTVYFEQELSKSGAEQIAAKVNAGVADGAKGVPVYWGHPDVPELAHKYPDKRAKGWIKSATVGPDFLELRVEWLEDNATDGFGWFSPYWGGPAELLANGRYLKTVNDLTSVALINIPNIQEFRLANESQGGEQTKGKAFAMPQHLIDLARRFDERVHLANEANFDESKHPRSDDGKFSSGGGGGGKSAGATQSGGGTSYREKQIAARQADVDSAQKAFDEAKAALIAGQKRGWSKEEDDKAFKVYYRAERKLAFAKSELRSAIGAPPISRAEQMRRDTKDVFHGNASQATRARLIAELAARFNSARKAK